MGLSRRVIIAIMAGAAVLGAFVLLRSAPRNDGGPSGVTRHAKPFDLDIEAIRAGYEANEARFATLRVTWRETSGNEPGWFAANVKQASQFEEDARKPDLEPSVKASLLEQAQQLRKLNKFNREPNSRKFDFWTDGRGVQVRVPLPGAAPMTTPEFPDAPLTPESLVQEYASIGIISWAPGQTGSLRAWWGVDTRDGTGRASISDTTIQESIANFQFPPYGMRSETWGGQGAQRHLVDLVLVDPSADLRIVRPEAVHGKQTMVVDRTWVSSSPEGLTRQPGKVELLERVRAWIDPSQGFLPLRVESCRGWRFNGKVLGDPNSWKPNLVAELAEIAAVKGGFYPKKCVMTTYVADPTLTQNVNDIEGLIAGTASDLITVPYQRTTWEAIRIEAGRSMPSEMFAPRFPESTDVVDATKSKTPVRAQPLQPGDPAPEWEVSAWTDGHSRKLSDFRGRVVLLDFWGVWCAPCLQGLPAIQAIQDKFGDQVVCLEIHTAGADVAKVQKMLDSKSVKSPSAIDQGPGGKGITGQRYGVESWPHMVLIDRQGNVAWTTLDANTESVMSDAANAADIPWPPKDMSDEQMHRLRTTALSILIEKVLASSGT